MDTALIKSAPTLNLKPNKYFTEIDVPFLYQKRGILMMLTRRRMVLGDDVGLGKTLEAIVTYSYIKTRDENVKAVVFTEKIGFRQWMDEFKWLTPDLRVRLITRRTHPDRTARIKAFRQHGADVIVTSYSMVYNYAHHIVEGLGKGWILIADEPNFFKNTNTQLHRAMFNMVNDPLKGGQVGPTD